MEITSDGLSPAVFQDIHPREVPRVLTFDVPAWSIDRWEKSKQNAMNPCSTWGKTIHFLMSLVRERNDSTDSLNVKGFGNHILTFCRILLGTDDCGESVGDYFYGSRNPSSQNTARCILGFAILKWSALLCKCTDCCELYWIGLSMMREYRWFNESLDVSDPALTRLMLGLNLEYEGDYAGLKWLSSLVSDGIWPPTTLVRTERDFLTDLEWRNFLVSEGILPPPHITFSNIGDVGVWIRGAEQVRYRPNNRDFSTPLEF